MKRAATIAVSLALVVGASAVGTLWWRTDDGRSAVGVARRTDGSVAVVTAWCAGPRVDQPVIAEWRDGRSGDRLMAASGPSDASWTVHIAGRSNGTMTESVNEPIPEDQDLVAFNAGHPDSWWPRQGYPSAAVVFRVADLPVSDAAVPREVMVGEGEVVATNEFIARRCAPSSDPAATR